MSLVSAFSAVSSACLVIRKSLYKEVGGFNERDLKISFNDVDFCLRVREAGYRNIWTPYAELYHFESSTVDTLEREVTLKRFGTDLKRVSDRWGDRIWADPFYNPNLTDKKDDFSLADKPRGAKPGKVSLRRYNTIHARPDRGEEVDSD